MINLSLLDLSTLLGVPSDYPTVQFNGISKDTRTLSKGNLYVAIIGESLDGHNYVQEAYSKGASAALVSRLVDCSIPQILVNDTLEALGKIGENWRDRFELPIIGVTGSNGKTTLKNMIASILQAACQNNAANVFATEGNLNNNIGLPLTLTQLDKNHRYGVIEMGMNHFGEIAYLTKMAKPDVAVINNAAEAHLEGLHDVAGVAKAKGEIFQGLQKDGVAILNKDDPHYDYWCGLVKNHRQINFGFNPDADVTLADTHVTQHATHQDFTMKTPSGDVTIHLPLLGQHNVKNALAATAATLAIGIDIHDIKRGLETVQPAKGRMNHHTLKSGAQLIDDTYNANPFSLQAAVNALAAFEGTKILVLGDMRELGPDAKQFHFSAGEKIRAAGIQHLFAFGELCKEAAAGFGENAHHFSDKTKLIEALAPYAKPDTTILVKGSRSMKMEVIVAGLLPKKNIEKAH